MNLPMLNREPFQIWFLQASSWSLLLFRADFLYSTTVVAGYVKHGTHEGVPCTIAALLPILRSAPAGHACSQWRRGDHGWCSQVSYYRRQPLLVHGRDEWGR